MDPFTVFIQTYFLVFINELGDKSQLATGTSVLVNRKKKLVIFISASIALTIVSGVTVAGTMIIPQAWLPMIEKIGGGLLILYSGYLIGKADNHEESDEETSGIKSLLQLFFIHLLVVATGEIGDKTMISTAAIAIENQTLLWVVFIASVASLVSVTAITVLLAAKIPARAAKWLQPFGALLMAAYGFFMIW